MWFYSGSTPEFIVSNQELPLMKDGDLTYGFWLVLKTLGALIGHGLVYAFFINLYLRGHAKADVFYTEESPHIQAYRESVNGKPGLKKDFMGSELDSSYSSNANTYKEENSFLAGIDANNSYFKIITEEAAGYIRGEEEKAMDKARKVFARIQKEGGIDAAHH